MKLQTILISKSATALGVTISRLLPPRLGYPFVRAVADIISKRRKNPMVRAVRANQWVLHGGDVSPTKLERLVRETFRSSARSMYEFWHYYKDSSTVLDMVEFDPSMDRCIERALQEKDGTLMVGPHITNFDMVGRALALRGMKMQVLSYPQPPGGYRWQNQIRELDGVTVTPMSIQALRKASETLRAGDTVLTGVDRPLPTDEKAKYRPRFFGRAASLPVFYIRLALKHNLPITILGGCRKPDGRYYVWASGPIHMQRSNDLVEETLTNTETVLAAVSQVIRRAPKQWAMFYPVWPEVMNLVNP